MHDKPGTCQRGERTFLRYDCRMTFPLLRAFLLASFALLTVSMAHADLPDYKPMYLWPDGAPGAKGEDEKDKPSVAIYPAAKDKANGTAVIIAPGGGYHVHAIDHEGVQVARFLNAKGITVFMLKYRLKPGYQPDVSLIDAKRSVRYVRSKAKEFNISRTRIGMLGFSAGGHLASAAGTDFDAGNASAADAIERVSSRPDFLVLGYPAISDKLRKGYPATDVKGTEKTPPGFIWFTSEDGLNPEHGILFYQALRKAKVEAEIHIYARGVHGLGLAPGDSAVGQWPAQLHIWLRQAGLLTDAKRFEVSGVVTIDGKPIHRGWVTLVPDDPTLPVASAYITERVASKFTIPASHGPCAGGHRIIVHEVARQFLTVPSMEDARQFTAATPGGEPMKINLAPDSPGIEVVVRSK